MRPLITVLIFLSLYFPAFSQENIVSVNHIHYYLYDENTGKTNEEVDASYGYEFLPGHETLGKIAPIIEYCNKSDHLNLTFDVHLTIKNIYYDEILYTSNYSVNLNNLKDNPDNRIISVLDYKGNLLDFSSENYSGMPPGAIVKISFPEYIPLYFQDNNTGQFELISYIDNIRTESGLITDRFPEDDTLAAMAFVVSNARYELLEHCNNNSQKDNKFIPNTLRWNSRGVEIVDGRDYTYQPRILRYYDDSADSIVEYSNVMRFNRVDLNNKEYDDGMQDYIVSGIFDLSGRKNVNLAFTYQRAGKVPGDSYDRGFSDSILIGPEHRVIHNGNANDVIREPDELIVEFAWAEKDSIHKLINIPEEAWRQHPTYDGSAYITDNPAYTLFGGGGYRTGFHNINYDSALTYEEGLKSDITDIGKDLFFRKANVFLPDKFLKDKIMRIRFRVNAKDNGNKYGAFPKDDFDDFYIEEIILNCLGESSEVGINSFFLKKENTIKPVDQMSKPFLSVELSNNSKITMPWILIAGHINNNNNTYYHYCWWWDDEDGDGYCDNCGKYKAPQIMEELPYLSKCNIVNYICRLNNYISNPLFGSIPGSNIYSAKFRLMLPDEDIDNLNDTLITDFQVYLDEKFAYDRIDNNGINDAEIISGIDGKGLNLWGFSHEESMPEYEYGFESANSGGKIAISFELSKADTIYGIQAYYGGKNTEKSELRLSICSNESGSPGEEIEGSEINTLRFYDDIREDFYQDEYVTSLYKNPIILARGRYWAVIEQPAGKPLELGASSYRGGMITTNYCDNPDESSCFYIHRDYKYYNNYDSLLNSELFAYRNNYSDDWVPFAPDKGNPAYAHLDNEGNVNGVKTYTRGTWIPMIRVFMDSVSYFAVSSVPDNIPDYIEIGELSPNPVNDKVKLSYSLSKAARISIDVFDTRGSKLLSLSEGLKETGDYRESYDIQGLTAGIYFIKFSLPDGQIVKKMVVVD